MSDNVVPFKKYVNYFKDDDFDLIDPNNLLKEDEPVWRCNCGSLLFVIKPTGPYCNQCGKETIGWDYD